MRSGGAYKEQIAVCSIEDVKQGKWYFRQLAVDGKRQSRSRLPAEGEYLREDALSATSFKFSEGDMRKWHNLDDVEVLVFHSWNESRMRIASLDEEKRIVEFRDPKAGISSVGTVLVVRIGTTSRMYWKA